MWPFAPSLLTSHAPSEENTWTVLDAMRLFLFYSTIGVQARRGVVSELCVDGKTATACFPADISDTTQTGLPANFRQKAPETMAVSSVPRGGGRRGGVRLPGIAGVLFVLGHAGAQLEEIFQRVVPERSAQAEQHPGEHDAAPRLREQIAVEAHRTVAGPLGGGVQHVGFRPAGSGAELHGTQVPGRQYEVVMCPALLRGSLHRRVGVADGALDIGQRVRPPIRLQRIEAPAHDEFQSRAVRLRP